MVNINKMSASTFVSQFSTPGSLDSVNIHELKTLLLRLVSSIEPKEANQTLSIIDPTFDFSICEAIRICFRMPIPLTFDEMSTVVSKLLATITNKWLEDDSDSVTLSALKCINNIIFNNPERMNLFCESNGLINGIQKITTILHNGLTVVTPLNVLLSIQYMIRLLTMITTQR